MSNEMTSAIQKAMVIHYHTLLNNRKDEAKIILKSKITGLKNGNCFWCCNMEGNVTYLETFFKKQILKNFISYHFLILFNIFAFVLILHSFSTIWYQTQQTHFFCDLELTQYIVQVQILKLIYFISEQNPEIHRGGCVCMYVCVYVTFLFYLKLRKIIDVIFQRQSAYNKFDKV